MWVRYEPVTVDGDVPDPVEPVFDELLVDDPLDALLEPVVPLPPGRAPLGPPDAFVPVSNTANAPSTTPPSNARTPVSMPFDDALRKLCPAVDTSQPAAIGKPTAPIRSTTR